MVQELVCCSQHDIFWNDLLAFIVLPCELSKNKFLFQKFISTYAGLNSGFRQVPCMMLFLASLAPSPL